MRSEIAAPVFGKFGIRLGSRDWLIPHVEFNARTGSNKILQYYSLEMEGTRATTLVSLYQSLNYVQLKGADQVPPVNQDPCAAIYYTIKGAVNIPVPRLIKAHFVGFLEL